MPVCSLCGVDKAPEHFTERRGGRHRPGSLRRQCKPCRSTQESARRYGLTVGDVEAIREAQQNRCAICGTHAGDVPHATFSHNPLVIDHDHKTGRVRGLLCPTCNAGLGHFKDNPDRLRAAALYCERA